MIMTAVNWNDTEKVMDTRAVTLSLQLIMSYKILLRLRTTTSTVEKNQNVYIFKSLNVLFKSARTSTKFSSVEIQV